MKISVLGTGMVGQGIADKLVSVGHSVRMGARQSQNEAAMQFTARHPGNASNGTFDDAASFGEMLVIATKGATALEVLAAVSPAHLKGKVIIDISNPLDFSGGGMPTLSISNTDSLGEQVQKAFPDIRLVKTLNTMNVGMMVNPGQLSQDTDVFVSGNDAAAKAQVVALLQSFGWKSPIDLGDITTARGTEMILPLWIRLWSSLGTPTFNFKIVR
jgi:8-hydroxy-5-deazaflavin:NADPH oxidoreductase